LPKMTFQVSPEMDSILGQLAAQRDIPKAQVIRRAVLLMKYLDSADKEIRVTDKSTGETSTVVLETQL
jgi:predicted transcriptional regulator